MSKSRDIVLLSVEAGCSDRTVRRYYDGQRVIPVIERAIKEAAKKLRIKLPTAVVGSRHRKTKRVAAASVL